MLESIKTPEMDKLGDMFKTAGFEIRLVGGVVRDLIAGLTPKDIDFCTDATPEEMIALAKQHNIMVIPTGLQHGTVTFVINNEQYEVTTLRTDIDTDGRHATVEFVRNFEIDSARRDLSINSMSMDFQGNIFDYFGGVEDLKAGRVRFVGDAKIRILEDYLRILRYFRFLVRFGKLSLVDILRSHEASVIRETRHGLTAISGERIWAEMSKIFSLENSGVVVQAMRSLGVMRILGIPCSSSSYEFISQSNDPVLNLATMVYSEDDIDVLIDRWKVSSKERARLAFYFRKDLVYRGITYDWFTYDELLSWMVRGETRENVVGMARYQDFMTGTDFAPLLEEVEIPVFPVTGADLVQKGFKPGKEFGDILKGLKDRWIEGNYTETKDQLLVDL